MKDYTSPEVIQGITFFECIDFPNLLTIKKSYRDISLWQVHIELNGKITV
jgi:hypothetical protein